MRKKFSSICAPFHYLKAGSKENRNSVTAFSCDKSDCDLSTRCGSQQLRIITKQKMNRACLPGSTFVMDP